MYKFVLVLTFFFLFCFAVKAAPRLFDVFSSKNTAAFKPANTVNKKKALRVAAILYSVLVEQVLQQSHSRDKATYESISMCIAS